MAKIAHRHRHPEDRAAVRRLRRSRSLYLERTAEDGAALPKNSSAAPTRGCMSTSMTQSSVTSPTWSSSTLTATSWRVLAIGSSPRHRARGLYVAFKYNIKEMEVESSDEAV